MIRNLTDLAAVERDVAEHYRSTRAELEGLGVHLRAIAADDQLVASMTSAGWSELAIGAWLVVSSLAYAQLIPADSCPAQLMQAAVYGRGGRVR